MKTKRIIFMISHESDGISVFNHRAYNFKSLSYFRASVDIITDEKRLSLSMGVAVFFWRITQLHQQVLELIRMTMNIAYKVVHQYFLEHNGNLFLFFAFKQGRRFE